MNNDFLHKFIEHGGGQGIETLVFVDQDNKLFCGLLLALIAGNGLFQFFDFTGKLVLLIGIPCVKGGKTRFRQFTKNLILIDLA